MRVKRAPIIALALAFSSAAWAQEPYRHASELESPYAPSVRKFYYAQLAKNPWRALGAELLVPGAGNYYVGLYVPAVLTLALSCVGASLWIAGAVRGRDATMWAGVGTFAGARVYGVISAPTSAVLLNAAFRRQFGIKE